MTMNKSNLKKYFALGLAAICMSVVLTNAGEAADSSKKKEPQRPAMSQSSTTNKKDAFEKVHDKDFAKTSSQKETNGKWNKDSSDKNRDNHSWNRNNDNYRRDRDNDSYKKDKDRDHDWNKKHDSDKNKNHKAGLHAVSGTHFSFSRSDVIFYAYDEPKHHGGDRCTRYSHRDWGQHIHCSNRQHDHKDSNIECRYDTCHNRHPFGNIHHHEN